MPDVFTTLYKPDVLSCLADLSNDEVFTPPSVVNDMLDMLPQELFESPDTTFLDPVCKSGVFLREIAKRLIKGLEDKIPDLQERIDHIFQKQLYGIAITELTSLLSRRSVYCSKYPNSKYSVSQFDDVQGNIRYKNTQHEWVKGKCCFCGATESEYGTQKRDGMESHAYEFIHTTKPQEIYNMKFDVIIGNPPYQLSDGGAGASAMPIYQKFVSQAKKLMPKYLTMIIPSRWFAGGRALDVFRDTMLNDKHLKVLVDYQNSKDCFSGVDIAGGICYFLWDKEYNGKCLVSNIIDNKINSQMRNLNEFSQFVRSNIGLDIIHKVRKKTTVFLSEKMYNYNPFLIRSFIVGESIQFTNSLKLFSSKGVSYINAKEITKNADIIDKYKVIIGKVSSEHAGIPDKSGKYRILSSLKVLNPGEVCSESYVLLACFNNFKDANGFVNYMSLLLPRFLILQVMTSINFTKDSFVFVPYITDIYNDEDLFHYYELTTNEIEYVKSLIKPIG